MKNNVAWVLLICLLLVVQACGEEAIVPDDEVIDEVTDETVADVTDVTFLDTEWVVNDYKYHRLPAKLKNKASIKFTGPGPVVYATGKAFMNGYTGYFKLDEKQQLVLSVKDLISTLMGGTDDEMAAEKTFFRNLWYAKSYRLNGNILTIYSDDGEVGYFVPKK